MAKTDIEAAYRIIPIHHSDHELLGIFWQDQYYYDTCLPFGASSLASATVISYMSALSFIFKLGNYPDVPQHFIIRKMLQGFKKLKSSSDSRLPITPSILKDLVNSLSHTVSVHFHRILFKAMYLLAFHAFLHIGELTSSGASKHFLLHEHVIMSCVSPF